MNDFIKETINETFRSRRQKRNSRLKAAENEQIPPSLTVHNGKSEGKPIDSEIETEVDEIVDESINRLLPLLTEPWKAPADEITKTSENVMLKAHLLRFGIPQTNPSEAPAEDESWMPHSDANNDKAPADIKEILANRLCMFFLATNRGNKNLYDYSLEEATRILAMPLIEQARREGAK